VLFVAASERAECAEPIVGATAAMPRDATAASRPG